MSGVTVRGATRGDFEKVYPLLAEFKNPYVGREARQRLFSDPWGAGAENCGTVMFDGGEAVGFLGALHSRRRIRGREHRFCNLTNWIVREPYRGRSLFLLLPLLRDRDVTVTDLTPSLEVYRLLVRAGFKDLETRMRICFPPGGPAPFGPRVEILSDPAGVDAALSEEGRRLRNDHLFPGCRHLVVRSGGAQCHLVFNRMVRRKKPFLLAALLHAGNREFLAEHFPRLVLPLCARLGVAALFVDERYLSGRRVPFSAGRALKQPRVFRSDALEAGDVDGLYSELPVLNL